MSRTSWLSACASSTLARIARLSSSSETGFTSGPTCPGYAGSIPSGSAMITLAGDADAEGEAGAGEPAARLRPTICAKA